MEDRGEGGLVVNMTMMMRTEESEITQGHERTRNERFRSVFPLSLSSYLTLPPSCAPALYCAFTSPSFLEFPRSVSTAGILIGRVQEEWLIVAAGRRIAEEGTFS